MATKDKEIPVEETKAPETPVKETKKTEIPVEETKAIEAKIPEVTQENISEMQVLVAISKDDEVKTIELTYVGYQNMQADIETCKASPDRLVSNWKGYRLATEEEVAAFLNKSEIKVQFANKYLAK